MDFVRIAARVAADEPAVPGDMEAIFMSIEFPSGMTKQEAVERAKNLVPCKVGDWEDVDEGEGWLAGNMYCEPGFYEANPDGDEYGPDDAGVKVAWETPFGSSEEEEEDPGPPSDPGPPWDTLEEKRGDK